MVLATNFFDQAHSAVLLPVWARDRVGSAAALGAVFGAFGAGAVLGNLPFTALSARLPRYRTFALGFLASGGWPFVVLAVTDSVLLVCAAAVWTGFIGAGINPVMSAVTFERVPPELQGRVLGLLRTVSWAGIPVGGLAGGLAVAGLGLTPALLLAGGLYIGVTLVPLIAPVWRELDVVRSSDDASGQPVPVA
jgi:MFS family permease